MVEIEKGLYAEIKEYCEYNGLKLGEYINGLVRRAFNEDRYGKMPSIFNVSQSSDVKPVSETKKEVPVPETVEEEKTEEPEKMETKVKEEHNEKAPVRKKRILK